MRLVETSAPDTEPVSLEDMKLHLRVTANGDDDLISSLITAAREMCEAYTGLALVTREYSLFLDSWKEEMALPRPPLQSVEAVHVYAADDTSAEFTDYIVSTGRPGRMVLSAWPPLPEKIVDGIEVQFTAGYGEAGDVPAALRQGIRQLVAHLYERRGDSAENALILSGALLLFSPFRQMSIA